MKTFASIALLARLSGYASAICTGFTFGVGTQQNLGKGISRWLIYDGQCNVHDSLITDENPCDVGKCEYSDT